MILTSKTRTKYYRPQWERWTNASIVASTAASDTQVWSLRDGFFFYKMGWGGAGGINTFYFWDHSCVLCFSSGATPAYLSVTVAFFLHFLFKIIEKTLATPSLGELGDWAIFVGGEFFFKKFKHQVQGICGQVHWLKSQGWPMVKICPEIINFSGFWPRINKILPRKKICPSFWKNYPKYNKGILPWCQAQICHGPFAQSASMFDVGKEMLVICNSFSIWMVTKSF